MVPRHRRRAAAGKRGDASSCDLIPDVIPAPSHHAAAAATSISMGTPVGSRGRSLGRRSSVVAFNAYHCLARAYKVACAKPAAPQLSHRPCYRSAEDLFHLRVQQVERDTQSAEEGTVCRLSAGRGVKSEE